MHPAFYWWWKNARKSSAEGCEARAECGPPGGHGPGRRHGHGHGHGHGEHFGGHDEPFGGGPFGVRRPLRFLANKLELSETQVEELARILNELKTERAQGEVDHQRTIAAFSDAIEGAAFDETRDAEGGQKRVESAERLRAGVLRALGRIHATLDEAQRKKLSYLIRTGNPLNLRLDAAARSVLSARRLLRASRRRPPRARRFFPPPATDLAREGTPPAIGIAGGVFFPTQPRPVPGRFFSRRATIVVAFFHAAHDPH